MGRFHYNFILFLLHLFILANSETCPTQCVCKKIKPSLPTADNLKAQCRGIKEIFSIEKIDFSSIETDLVQLNMSENAISMLPTIHLSVLQKLDLSKNKLMSLRPDVFKGMPNLRILDISNNYLKHIERGLFSGLRNLERLNISGNRISSISKGAFDDLLSLKKLDISNNPLTCDCELLWLLDWLQNTSVKLSTSPICESPPSFKGKRLRKLKVGDEIRCKSPVRYRDPTAIELKPDKDQIVFEGDNLKMKCRAPSVTADEFRSTDDGYSNTAIVWRFGNEDPNERFPNIQIADRLLDESGLVDSTLTGVVTRNHTGTWYCHLISHRGNHSKSIQLIVISNETQLCDNTMTVNNKGKYFWPKTIYGNTVNQPCEGSQNGVHESVTYFCNSSGQWQNLDSSLCPYISETTKFLEHFSKTNLSLLEVNLSESVKHLRNYTINERIFKDDMDVVFMSRTIENYVDYVKAERELGAFLIEMISSIMKLNKKLLESAQKQDKACSRLVRVIQNVSESTPSSESQKPNLVVENFRVQPQNFYGLICTWYSGSGKGRSMRQFYCTTSNHLSLDDQTIEASIQIPPSLFTQLSHEGVVFRSSLQLIIAMYANGNFFPTFDPNVVVMSAVVGASFSEMQVTNLSEPITIMYRYALLQDVEAPSLAWWDSELNSGIGGWNKNGCALSYYMQETLIFSCNRLAYYGMLQDVEFAPPAYTSGAKFHSSHPAIYVGTSVLLTCLCISIFFYLIYHNSIQMAKRAKHSFINTCIAIGLLVLIFTFGVFQTEDISLCQMIGIILHYLSLSVLLWMCVTISSLYERVSRTSLNELSDDELASGVPVQKPILGLYLVGWGIALIVCGISGAINMREYASHSYCFLYSGPALSALFAPALILIVFIIIFFLLVRCAIRSSDTHGQLSEGTQATENVDLDLLEPNTSMDRHSYKSISSRTASSNIEDPEHCVNTQLKAHVIVFVLFVTMWLCGSLTARRIFKNVIPYDEHIFSITYSVLAVLLGSFIVFFYCIARNDVRGKWKFIKQSWCRSRSISDTNAYMQQNVNQPLTNPIIAASTSGYPVEINNSRSSSRTSSHTKSHNSNVLKAAVDLNGITLNDPNAEAKIANVNLVVLHRQQYRTNNTLSSLGSTNGAEMFYNPHQSTVARKFFRKQRKNMMKHNNLGVRRRADGANSDNTSIMSNSDRNSSLAKTLHKDRLNSSNIFGTGTKVNNTNIHVEPVKEVKQQNKNILSDSGDESETLIGHVAGPTVNRLISESEHLRNSVQSVYSRNNDGSPKKRPNDISIMQEPITENMRTVSQQCSLEYSSESPQELDVENEIEQNVNHSEIAAKDLTSESLCGEESIIGENLVNTDIDEISACSYNEREHLECSLTPENNEGMYSLADLDGHLMSDNNDLYNTDEGSFNVPSLRSYDIQDREYDSPSNITYDNYEKAESVMSHGIYPQMPKAIYENPLHSHILDRTGSTTTLDSEVIFNKYQISEVSAVESITSDCDDCEDAGQCNIARSPVSTGEIDEIYEQINRPRPHNKHSYRKGNEQASPVLFPPNISLESDLNEIEINTDFRFNTQGVVTKSHMSSGSSRSSIVSESDKRETTV